MDIKQLLIPALLAAALPAVHATQLHEQLAYACPECASRIQTETGAYILEHGEEALISRAWLAEQAGRSIDVQYFIWSTDNIGILAGEALLTAAERGVKVRVLVDDLLVDAQARTLLALAALTNVQIKIYNPQHSVGVSRWQRIKNVLTDFHKANQRMHDKAVIYDGLVGVTGGRNMADEYFDYNQHYNFRDRDILLVGLAATAMQANFEEFWQSPLAVPVADLYPDEARKLSADDIAAHAQALHDYARDEGNFSNEVRHMLQALPAKAANILDALEWGEVDYISDAPGKNDGTLFLAGGGESTRSLVDLLKRAKSSVFIQSPYLVMPEGGLQLLQELEGRGVSVIISTNSLASTDNLMAFSGYAKQREALLAAGVEIHEYKPHPKIQRDLVQRYPALAEHNPIFALHAKSMVVDGEHLFIGTFNLDPRSANLNTEVGALLSNRVLAQQLQTSMTHDIAPENSWRVSQDVNADGEATLGKRLHLKFYKLLPLTPVL